MSDKQVLMKESESKSEREVINKVRTNEARYIMRKKQLEYSSNNRKDGWEKGPEDAR